MSMYAELLVMSFLQRASNGDPLSDVGDLLSRLLSCRKRLHPPTVRDGGAAGDLAANIDYDLALLRLCSARGIRCDPVWFDRPILERCRLESELAGCGVDLGAFDSNG
jgi:hypothetical protein